MVSIELGVCYFTCKEGEQHAWKEPVHESRNLSANSYHMCRPALLKKVCSYHLRLAALGKVFYFPMSFFELIQTRFKFLLKKQGSPLTDLNLAF